MGRGGGRRRGRIIVTITPGRLDVDVKLVGDLLERHKRVAQLQVEPVVVGRKAEGKVASERDTKRDLHRKVELILFLCTL